MLTFVFIIFCNIFTSLPYVEFASRIDDSGGTYSYTYVALGEFMASIIGHALIMNFSVTAAAISRSWSSYFGFILEQFAIPVPAWINKTEIYGLKLDLVAAISLLFLTYVMLRGVKDSITFNNIVSGLNCCNIIFIIIAGAFLYNGSKMYPFFKGDDPSSVLNSIGIAYFATIGYDNITAFSKESVNPKRDIPLAIISSVIISGIVYIIMSFVVIGLVPDEMLNSNQGLVNAFASFGWSTSSKIMSLGSLIGLTTSMFACLLGQPRVFQTIADDGLLPVCLSKVNPKTQVATNATYVSGVIAVFCALFLNLDTLANCISLACLMSYGISCIASIECRYEQSTYPVFRRICFIAFILFSILLGIASKNNIPRCIIYTVIIAMLLIVIFISSLKQTNIPDKIKEFRCPLMPLVPFIGVFTNFYMYGAIELFPHILYSVYLLIGAIIYFGFGIRHSKLNAKLD